MLEMLQNSPMLDNRGEETEDPEGDKTQPENHGGVNVAGRVNMFSFHQNIPEFGDAKPESDQRQAGANPRHEGSVSSLAGALFGQLIGYICAFGKLVHVRLQPQGKN